MVQIRVALCIICALYLSFASSASIQIDQNFLSSGTLKKRTKKSTTTVIAHSKILKKKEFCSSRVLTLSKALKSSKPSSAQSVNESEGKELNVSKDPKDLKMNIIAHPFSRKAIVPAIPKYTGPPPSSLAKINILMLMFYTTLGAAMPYIPLYYREIGLSNNQVGLLGAITPAVTFIASPFWCALADSTGWHKHIMLLTFIGSVLVRSGLALATKKTNIFWLYVTVAVSAVLNAPVKPLMDSAVMSMLKDKSDYGRSRLFGQIGFGLGSYIVGLMFSRDIRLIFVMQVVFAVPTAILMAGFQPTKSDKPKEKLDIIAAVNHMVSDPKVIVFFAMVFLIGVSSGIVENFAYVRLDEVGGSGSVIGVCRLVSSLAGGPMFWLSGAITKRIGVNGVLTWSFSSYVLRFIIYASIKNAWQAIPAEILRGTTFAVFWAGSTYFVYTVSPLALTATMLSILNCVYGGLGQSVGALVGGAMSKQYGISKSFYICGGVDFTVLSLFAIYQLRLSIIERRARNVLKWDKGGKNVPQAKNEKIEKKNGKKEEKKEEKKEKKDNKEKKGGKK